MVLPLTNIPVPTPKSATNLSVISPFCAALWIMQAAMWAEVGICSSSIFGLANTSAPESSDSRCFNFIMAPLLTVG